MLEKKIMSVLLPAAEALSARMGSGFRCMCVA